MTLSLSAVRAAADRLRYCPDHGYRITLFTNHDTHALFCDDFTRRGVVSIHSISPGVRWTSPCGEYNTAEFHWLPGRGYFLPQRRLDASAPV